MIKQVTIHLIYKFRVLIWKYFNSFLNAKYTVLQLMIIVFLISFQSVYSQSKTSDSLKKMTYDELKDAFYSSLKHNAIPKDSSTHKIINEHYKRAKQENDTFKIADSYFYLALISDYEKGLKYSDSIISLTLDANHKNYPALGYMTKGYVYYGNLKSKEALAEYLKAYDYAVKSKNIEHQMDIKSFVGGYYFMSGNYMEAIKYCKENLRFNRRKIKKRNVDKRGFLIALFDVSSAYLIGEMADSSLVYSKEGLLMSLEYEDEEMYNDFLAHVAEVYYLKDNPKRALDSLNKAMSTAPEDIYTLAYNNFLKGAIYDKIDSTKSIKYYIKADSIFQITQDPFLSLRKVYQRLYYHYSKHGSDQDKLTSIKKLIHIDSLLNATFRGYEKQIYTGYEIPKLKKEKEQLLIKIEEGNQFHSKKIFLLSLFMMFFISIGTYFYSKQKKYKKKYDSLILSTEHNLKTDDEHIENDAPIDISKDIIHEVLKKLAAFEDKRLFLKPTTLNKMARELGTNSTYLSKIINHYKRLSFSKYLNELRIDFIIQELKQNKQYRKYTIKALANEIGFNKAESFSKAFYKKTGIYPSFYIKQLNKEFNNSLK